ncbi:PilZ domain-containing protein [Endozoicomonas numazuensis]|uniref:Pilus assembly protein PilZ n=1 Tax=Endozoicomonas numazuensis TaxID=1137799 RepID=A0A081N405_9GAMM|nr:PilZ domain-containing protein [Endozoicomonas numazuensis]KEQ13178.1 pilus assembly protein PilZ [Endozoicomonas numazuensis]
MNRGKGGMSGILSLTIKDSSSLYSSYMPFITGGGLFIPTSKRYSLGDEVFIRLTLMDEVDKLPVPGKVVWITPQGSSRMAGIGVQFTDPTDAVRTKIETYLAGALQSDRETSTM